MNSGERKMAEAGRQRCRRKEYGGSRVDQPRRLKELEQENAKLKRLVRRESAGGNDRVDMWMEQDVRTPTVQDREKADLRTEALRIGGVKKVALFNHHLSQRRNENAVRSDAMQQSQGDSARQRGPARQAHPQPASPGARLRLPTFRDAFL